MISSNLLKILVIITILHIIASLNSYPKEEKNKQINQFIEKSLKIENKHQIKQKKIEIKQETIKEYSKRRSFEKMKIEQFSCLEKLWQKESGWNYLSRNKSSWAYGIPQALPASKMKTVANDWKTNSRTQVEWGLSYIQWRYKSPCRAWKHWQKKKWY